MMNRYLIEENIRNLYHILHKGQWHQKIRIVDILDRIAITRGLPEVITVDNVQITSQERNLPFR